ncbi:permease prefix domain 1-containing protein [Saccharothrix isguenensis]
MARVHHRDRRRAGRWTAAGAGLIDDYCVTALDRRLRGPEHVKDDLLAEARDSLHDAAAAHRDGGLAEDAAQRRAVAGFGAVSAIAREYRGVLGLAHGTRTLRAVMLVVPLIHVMWELNRRFWIGAWNDFDAPPPDWYLVIARLNDTSAWVVAGVAVLALLVGRLLARTALSTVTLARLAGAVAAGGRRDRRVVRRGAPAGRTRTSVCGVLVGVTRGCVTIVS